eukprot:TRINITY_DN43055_c0_g1_i1.p1 TRINITY_DN43055_c0_g1~~TRINITY_DN43055_c0_g1_i1.p1  ORF type:complete len:355 (+),score=67.27 TRINITY_DN43055_c0_g1_i1:39-1103(+)
MESPAGLGSTVVVGTYDGGLLGFALEDGSQSFGYAAHTGCVKAVHCSKAGKLASGATDHSIRLFDLSRGVELGELQEHEDSVSSLQYWGETSLVTGSSDGQIIVWRCGDYEVLLKFRGHKGAVNCLAVHSSGRMMASAGRDGRIQLWDLTRGTSAAHLESKETIDALEWSPSGKQIAALSAGELQVVNLDGCKVATFRDPSSSGLMRVSLVAVVFLAEDVVALGDGKGDVRILARNDDELFTEACQLPVEQATPGASTSRGRVKVLALAGRDRLIVGMSSGCVEIWRYPRKKMDSGKKPAASDFTRLQTVDTKCRLTCLAVWTAGQAGQVDAAAPQEPGRPGSVGGKKRKKKQT